MEAEFTSMEPGPVMDPNQEEVSSVAMNNIEDLETISQDAETISQDPETISQDPETISQDAETISQDPEVISFTSSGVTQASQEVIEIRDYLKAFSDKYIEATTEETTDYIKEIYNVQLTQGASLETVSSNLIIMGRDQQTVGLLSVGSMFVLIGILVIYMFLGRIR